LIKRHPQPHRLKVFLQLEANNMAIYMPDLFDTISKEALNHALDEAVVGSLSYNGQRCTALKLHYVPQQHADAFVQALVKRVESLPVGLPDQRHAGDKSSAVTPLPTQARIDYMQELIADALSKGAKIVNQKGGQVMGGPASTLMVPAVLYPVTPDMRVFHEEQFGPVIPVAVYQGLQEVLEFGQKGQPYGQQVSIFGQDPEHAAVLLDGFAAVFTKINLNQQCGRSPDTLPFAGRRSSAMGVMSVKDALREFSVPTVVAYKDIAGLNEKLVEGLQAKSNFLQPVSTVQ
jgi:glyceraldehyde-3-phosphate dehydrogenase (NADP+)